jgi:hypothetical protein
MLRRRGNRENRGRERWLVSGHLFRWSWLAFLYVVLFAWIFGTLGAWQFQDRLRIAAGSAENAEAWRIALIEEREGTIPKLFLLKQALDEARKRAQRDDMLLAEVRKKISASINDGFDVKALADVATYYYEVSKQAVAADVAAQITENQAKYQRFVVEMAHADELGLASIRPAPEGGLAAYLPSSFNLVAWVQPNTGRLATWPQGHLTILLTLLMGVLGSTLYTTRFMLDYAIKGYKLTEPAPYPTSWFLFRPLFGAATALAIFVLVKAGQLAFSLDAGSSDAPLNPFLIAFMAIVAGLMSWQALDLIQTTGARWLSSQNRDPRWAVGLQRVMTERGRGIDVLAAQIGRSRRQVERWLRFRDRVTPEMQERIAGALSDRERGEVQPEQIFGDELPSGRPLPSARLAIDLAKALEVADRKPADVAFRLNVTPEIVKRWMERSVPVDPVEQEALADMLDRPVDELFEPAPQPAAAPVRSDAAEQPMTLAAAMARAGIDAAAVATALSTAEAPVSREDIEAWIADPGSVPVGRRAAIAKALGVNQESIIWS